MSRHPVHLNQMAALRTMFGNDVVVEQERRPFDDAREIVRRFWSGRFDDLVVIAPLSVLAVLCQEGIRPLWSECVEENDKSKIDFRGARGQGFRFVRFRRVVELRLVFEDEITPGENREKETAK